MSASDCAVGLLVDLSEPSPKVTKPKQKRSRSKNRKKSTDKPSEKSTPKNSETKENSNPTPVEGVRRNSFTLNEAADISERILVDVTEKTSQTNCQSIWTLSDSNITPLDDERFDFDLAGSPAIPVPRQEKAEDDEVFFGPVSFVEKCTVAALKSESEVQPLSPLSSSQMAEIVKEAHTVAYRIASMMKDSSSESDRSNNSYSSPIARWKAVKRLTNKDKSTDKSPKQSSGSPKPNNISSIKTDQNTVKDTPITTPSPKSKVKEDETEGSGRRSSARIQRKSTFTIKDKEKKTFVRTPTQSLQFKDESPTVEKVSESHPPPHVESDSREVTTASTILKDTEQTQNNKKEVQNGKKPSRLRKSIGIPKPSGLKPPSSRMPVPANKSLHKSSSTESLMSVPCPGPRTRCDSFGSEGTADNLSIGSDISDISTASTASNVSTSSRTSKLLPNGRISGIGLPRITSKAESGLGLKRISYGGNASLNNAFNRNTGPMKADQSLQGLNKSLQTGSTKLNYSSSYGQDRLNSVRGANPRQRMSLGPSLKERTPGLQKDRTSALLKSSTPRLGVVAEPGHKATPALPVTKRLNNHGPLSKQALVRPTDIHRKTLAANRNKQMPAVNGPLKATGQVSTRSKAPTPKPHPAVKKTVESTPVKPNKSVQPKKLSLSTSFESPSRSNGSTGHVAASTPRSTSKSANRRSFLPTPSKISRLVSVGSIPASPLSFRGVSTSSVGSNGSSIRCDSDSAFENSEQ